MELNKIKWAFKMGKPEALADGAAIGSMLTFLGITLVQWDIIIHVVAGCVAVLAGILAITFHILKIREHTKRNRK